MQSVETVTIVREIPADGILFQAVSETRTEERCYAFAELSPDAQDAAVETERESRYAGIEPDELRNDDYWEEKAAEIGFTIRDRSYRTMGGGMSSELAVYWDSYPWRAYFIADVDVPAFVASLAPQERGKYRLLRSAMARGDVGDSATVGRTDSGSRLTSPEIDWYTEDGYIWRNWSTGELEHPPVTRAEIRYARLQKQVIAIEDAITEAYESLAAEFATNLEDQLDYLTGEYVARESLAESGNWFHADGRRFGEYRP